MSEESKFDLLMPCEYANFLENAKNFNDWFTEKHLLALIEAENFEFVSLIFSYYPQALNICRVLEIWQALPHKEMVEVSTRPNPLPNELKLKYSKFIEKCLFKAIADAKLNGRDYKENSKIRAELFFWINRYSNYPPTFTAHKLSKKDLKCISWLKLNSISAEIIRKIYSV